MARRRMRWPWDRPVVEQFSLRFAEDRPPAPALKPFWLTYMGDDVVELRGVGKFQNGTRANVGAEVARRFEGDALWRVERVPPRKRDEED